MTDRIKAIFIRVKLSKALGPRIRNRENKPLWILAQITKVDHQCGFKLNVIVEFGYRISQ